MQSIQTILKNHMVKLSQSESAFTSLGLLPSAIRPQRSKKASHRVKRRFAKRVSCLPCRLLCSYMGGEP